MINLHPPLSAFPFALLTMVGVLEVYDSLRPSLGIRNAIRVNLLAAALFVILAFFSGYQAGNAASQSFQISEEAIAWHHLCGRSLLFAIVPCVALGIIHETATHGAAVFRGLYRLNLLIVVVLVVYTGYLGGELVFTHGAGVSAGK